MVQPVIVWFRQDLRLSDHPALSAAAAAGPVLPVFILDDETPGDWRWGGASRWWLHRSLEKLDISLPLVFRRGRADEVLAALIEEVKPQGIYFTRDYAPWAGALEERIKNLCDRQGVACHRYGGFLLHEPESIRNGSGEFFKVYTPYSRACFAKGPIRALKPAPQIQPWQGVVQSLILADLKLLPTKPDWSGTLESHWTPGEAGAQQRLFDFIDHGLYGYAEGRDRPDRPHVSRLSAHFHWGEISPHQAWHTVERAMHEAEGKLDRDGEKFLKEILWREFSYSLIHHVPSFPTKPFRAEFEDFPWTDDPDALQRWQQGETGYPIVDAGLRELWATGIMHNRVRMIVASFLIKDLLVPWQAGERWFWDTLVDADIAANAASWQWVAGCGADAAPYFRIFNPVLQGLKFDPDGVYVRRWVPELAGLSNTDIHKPWEMPVLPRHYPKPMVDHGFARDRALAAFKTIKRNDTP